MKIIFICSKSITFNTFLKSQADYAGILNRLAEMKDVVDAFFDEVMVMADDLAVRKNRFTILNQTRSLFLEVADISILQE